MKLSKKKIGLMLAMIGIILFIMAYPANDLVDTFCGLFVGAGIGLYLGGGWSWTKNKTSLKEK